MRILQSTTYAPRRRLLVLLWAQLIAIAAIAQIPLPDAFNPGAGSFYPGANPWVGTMAVQADGRIVVGGTFQNLGSQELNGIGRLNPDGSPDACFNPVPTAGEGVAGYVYCLLIQSDGMILVGGEFSSVAGENRANIARLHPDGTLDLSFNPGANGGVISFALQSDGKILVGGAFSVLSGEGRANIGRLNSNGTIDTDFNPGANGAITVLTPLPNGQILVGGSFSELGGQSRRGVGRLESNGTLDVAFTPELDGSVHALALQPDGKIIVGGNFCVSFPDDCSGVGRLNTDGTVDTNFTAKAQEGRGDDTMALALAVQTDGKILVGGGFNMMNGQARTGIARLNPDSTLDESFNPVVEQFGNFNRPIVFCMTLQGDGRILVGGRFFRLGGQERLNIGRLNNTDPATQSLAYTNSTLTWIREGTSPEVWGARFELLSSDNTWTNLGIGTRVPIGWQLTNVVLPSNPRLRTRGYATDNGHSAWFVDTEFNQPLHILNSEYQTYFSFSPFGFGLRQQFGLLAAGPVGEAFVVEACSDLQAWMPIATNVPSNGLYFFVDQVTDIPNRFYRLRQGP